MNNNLITYESLENYIHNLKGSLILQNEFPELNESLGGGQELINGSLYNYYDDFGNSISKEEYEWNLKAYYIDCDDDDFDGDSGTYYYDADRNEIGSGEYFRMSYSYESDKEFHQYYIIDETAMNILKRFTDETIIYLTGMDCYMWCIDFIGKSWSNAKLRVNDILYKTIQEENI